MPHKGESTGTAPATTENNVQFITITIAYECHDKCSYGIKDNIFVERQELCN